MRFDTARPTRLSDTAPLFRPAIEKEISPVTGPLPARWAHSGVYSPCAGLRCGIPLSDYHLSPFTLPSAAPPFPSLSLPLSSHSDSVHVLQAEWKWEHPSPHTCTHTCSFLLCSGPCRTQGWCGARGCFSYRLECFTLSSHFVKEQSLELKVE